MMQLTERFQQPTRPEPFFWLNEPTQSHFGAGLEIFTDARTDFWQRTHYGFRRDDGHALLVRLDSDFALTAHVAYLPKVQYDQCGLMVRIDPENWIKTSTEFENESHSRLGSVVTNLGYSDWATQDVLSSHTEMWYRISRCGADFLVEASFDGERWLQLRIAHLHKAQDVVAAGVYACSPIGRAFHCRFTEVTIGESTWSGGEGA